MCRKLHGVMRLGGFRKQPRKVASSLTGGEGLPAIHLAMIGVLGIVLDSQFVWITAIAVQHSESAMLRIHSHKATVFPIGRAISNDTKDAAMAPNRCEGKGLTWSIRILRSATKRIVEPGLADTFGEGRIGGSGIGGKEIEAGGELLRRDGCDLERAFN